MANVHEGRSRTPWNDWNGGTTTATVTKAAATGKINALSTLVYSTDKTKAILTITGPTETHYLTLEDTNKSAQVVGAMRFEPPLEATEGTQLSVTITGDSVCGLIAVGITYN